MLHFFVILVSVLALTASAADKIFTIGGVDISLEDSTNRVAVYFNSMRLNRATGQWNVEVSLSNRTSQSISGPFVLFVDGFSGSTGVLQPDGVDQDGKSFFDLSNTIQGGKLLPGQKSLSRTLAMGMAAGSPSLLTRVFATFGAATSALGLTRTLDGAGEPLPNAQVIESGPAGMRTNHTDPVFGVVTLGTSAGPYTWQFSSPGYLPAWRQQSLAAGNVAMIPAPRLVRRDSNNVVVTPIAGGLITNAIGSIQITFAAGAVVQDSVATLTGLDGQSLPQFLPGGWSPLQAFNLELSGDASGASSAKVILWGTLQNGEQVVLVRWNPLIQQWNTVQILGGTTGARELTVMLPGGGAYAVVVPDAPPNGPSAAQVGQPLLPGGAASPGSGILVATGAVSPVSSAASLSSEMVTATATVILSNSAGPLPSGFLVRGDVREQYELRDGTTRHPPLYDNDIVAYRRPGDAGTTSVRGTFPMRPFLLFGAAQLSQATVFVDVIPPGLFSGGILETNGGVLIGDGIRILAGAGSLSGRQAAELRTIAPTNFADFMTNGLSIATAFELSIGGIAAGRHLSLQVDGIPTNGVFVLARVLYDQGLYGLQPVERLTSDAAGRLSSAENPGTNNLGGIIGSGQYVLVRVTSPQALVSGTAKNSQGQLVASLPVQISGQPWLTFSGADGSYKLLAPTGDVNVLVTDPMTGDGGVQSISIPNANASLIVDLVAMASGPRVLTVVPANNASSVSRVMPIIVSFSRPVNPATLLNGGLKLLGSNAMPVSSSLTLNLQSTSATILPTDPLNPSTLFTILVSTNVSDFLGRPLEGANQFSFVTESDALNRPGAQLIIYEPTNGIAGVFGTPGTADANSPVILVNDNTGETATILSLADGSFTNSIAADVEDFISAVLVNRNGTRTTLAASRQMFRDGNIGLYKAGGILEAQSDGGPVQVIVEPGAIPSETKFKLEPLELTELLTLLQNTLPESGQLLGGFRFTTSGDEITESADVSFPVNPSMLQLQPGESPTNRAFVLCEPVEIDGVMVFNIIDRMQYEDGKLMTHSPPFPGLGATAAGTFLALPIMMAFGTQLAIVGQVVSVSAMATNVTERDLRAGLTLDGYPVRRLPGAVVTAQPQSAVSSSTIGLRPGAFTAKANRNGFFALNFPVNSLQPDAILLRSLHPLLPGVEGRTALVPPAASDFQAGAVANLVLHVPGSGNFVDSFPPIVTVSQPITLLLHTNQTVTLNVRDNATLPNFLSAAIDYQASTALIPNRQLFAGEATLVTGPVMNTGLTGIQVPLTLNVQTTAVVVVETVVADLAGNARTNRLNLRFGGPPPAGANGLPVPANDTQGPSVVSVNPQKDGIIANGQMIVRFDEPIDKGIEANEDAVSVSPPLQSTRRLSPNQRELLVNFSGLVGGATYTVTLNSGQITDLSGNVLANSYPASFKTPAAAAVPLADVANAVATLAFHGVNFTLDRSQDDGTLVAHAAGGAATKIGSLSLPPYPRIMAVIPNFSYKVTTNGPVVTNTLMAVAGGLVGSDNVGQWLWFINISNPTNMVRIASELATIDPTAAITAMKWSPPHLCFTENRAEGSLVHHVNAQAFIIGANGLAIAKYMPGVDSNGDGDFVDSGETLPIPELLTLFGDEFIFSMEDRRLISDFDVAFGGSFEVAAVASRGSQNSFFQVLDWQGLPINDPGATSDGRVNFPLGSDNRQIRCVVLDLDFPLTDSTGTRFIPAAVVGVNNDVEIIDLTDPIAPVVVRTNHLGDSVGNIFSIMRSGDNEYAAGTSTGVFLLSRSALGGTSGPATTSQFTDLPMQGREFGANDLVISAAYGGVARLIVRPPQLRIVRVLPFPVLPSSSLLQSNLMYRSDFVAAATESEFIVPVPYSRCDDIPTELNGTNAPNPLFNHYPLVRFLGSTGPEMFVAAESLERSMELQPPKGADFPPVILSEKAGALGFGSQHPVVHALKLHRLSSNPLDDLYNTYIGTPFLVAIAPLSSSEQAKVTSVVGRQALWGGDFLRFSFDPPLNGGPELSPFLSSVASFVYTPNVSRTYRSFRGEYLDSPNVSFARAAPRVSGVDLQNGEFRHPETDVMVEGRHQPLSWTRVYESRSRYVGPLGRGWDFNYNARIQELSEDDFPPGYAIGVNLKGTDCDKVEGCGAMLIDGAGSVQVFTCLNPGDTNFPSYANDPAVAQFLGGSNQVAQFYKSPAAVFSVLYKLVNGHFVLVLPNGGRLEFLPDGRLDKSIGTFSKSVVQCEYGDDGKLTGVVGDRGAKLEIGYYKRFPSSSFGLADVASSDPLKLGKIALVRVSPSLANASQVAYDYDATGNLWMITPKMAPPTILVWSSGNPHELHAFGRGDGTEMPGQTMNYQEGMVSSVVLNGDNLKFAGAKATSRERFDAGPSAVSVTVGSSPSASFNIDQRGRPTEFAGRPFSADDEGRPDEVADTYSDARLMYDTANPIYRFRNNLIRTMEGPAGSAGKFVTGNQYDGSAWNRVQATTNVNGVITVYDYSQAGDFTQGGEIKEATGPVVVRHDHNAFGQVTADFQQDAASGVTPPFERDYAYSIASLSPDGGLRTGEFAPGLNGSTTVRDSFGRVGAMTGQGLSYTTMYNNDGQPQTIQNTSGATPSVSYTYNEGRVETETLNGGALLARNSYTYDSMQKEKVHQLTREETGLPASVTVYTYDGQGRLDHFISDGELTQLTYDGELTTGLDGPGQSRVVAYGASGLAQSVTEQGVTADLTYDSAQRLETVTQQGAMTKLIYDDNGSTLRRRLKSKEVLGGGGGTFSKETYTYDDAGRVKTITSKSNRVREFDYFANNEVRSMKINGTEVRRAQRNSAGLLTQSRVNDLRYDYLNFDSVSGQPQTETVTLQPGSRTVQRQITYDTQGRIDTVTVTGTGGGNYDYDYDTFGNPTKRADPDGVAVSESSSPGGKLLNITFSDGRQVIRQYNAQRRLRFITGGPGVMEYTYDADGLVSGITYPDGTTGAFKDRNSFFEPDTVMQGSIEQKQTWTDGRLTEIDVPSTGDSLSYTYDLGGRRTSATLNDTSVVLGYNDDGALSSQTNTASQTTRIWSADFNALNQLQSETYPSGVQLVLAPDTFGHPTSASAVGISSVDWIGGGLIERVRFSGGVRMVRHYDAGLRTTGITYETGPDGSPVVVAGFSYSLTSGGRILSETRSHEGRVDVFKRNSAASGMRIQDFLFSATNAATGAGAVSSVTGITFSPFGELEPTSAASGIDARGFQPSFTESGGRVVSFDGQPVNYNDRGSVTNVPLYVYLPGQGVLTRVQAVIDYDGFGQLLHVTRDDGVEISYAHDGFGHISRRVVTGPPARARSGTNEYFWAADRLLEEREQTGGTNVIRRYIYLGRYMVLLQVAPSESGPFTNFVPLINVNGSIGGYASTGGQLVETILYSAYGTPVFPGRAGDDPPFGGRSLIANTLLFHGAFFDEATGLYEMGERDLHPQMGRFLERDSVLFGESAAMFTAFNGDPVGRVDPLGTFSVSEILAAKEQFDEGQKSAEEFGKSADGFLAALNDSRLDRSRKNSALGLAGLDLASSSLTLASAFGDDDFKMFVSETTEQLGHVKTFLDIAGAISELQNDREMLAAIKSVAWSRPVPGFFTVRQVLQDGGGWSAISVGSLEQRFGEDSNFKRAKYYDINRESRLAIESDATEDYLNKRTGHVLSIGKGVHSLLDAYLNKSLEGNMSHTADIQRQLSKTTGKLLDFAEAYRGALAAKDLEILRTVYGAESVGLVRTLGVAEVGSAVYAAGVLGFEAGKLAIITLNDEDVARAYQQQLTQFEEDGGWLTVASGLLSTVGADDTALLIQEFHDTDFSSYARMAYDQYTDYREKQAERTDYYLRGIKAP